MGFGERLKELRVGMGLSQREFADKIHVSTSAVSHFENETNYPKMAVLIQIMCVLECDANYLYQDYLKQDMRQDFNADERDLVEKFRCISSHAKEVLLTILRMEYKLSVEKWRTHNMLSLSVYIPVRKGNGYVLANKTKKICAYSTTLNRQADCGILIVQGRLRPTFKNGDIALIKRKLKVHHNEIGLYEIDGQIHIMKMYRYRGDVKLFPLNLADKTIHVTPGMKYRCLGRVIGKLEGVCIDKCE